MYVLTNGIIYTNNQAGDALTQAPALRQDEALSDHCIVIKGEYIHAILPQSDCPPDLPQIDVKGANITAGFIDLQLNGCGGVLFNTETSIETLEIMQRTNERFGCTSFLPTLITATDDDMKRAIKTMADYLLQHKHQALGLHLEGPYLSTAKKGIHSAELVRESEQHMIDHISANRGVITKVTLAPEQTTPAHIRQLTQAGIIVSLGHSNASYTQSMQSFNAGATFTTHLFNAMSSITGREPGLVGATFDNAKGYAGIIVDGHHVDYANIRMSHKLLGERLVLVTDAVSPAGANIDSFDFVGTEVFYRNGKCVGADGTLGGSALTMIEAVKNTVKHVGLPLAEALRMASLYPAKAIAMDHKLGSISVNKIANITIFDNDFNVQTTIVNGQVKQIASPNEA